MADNRQNIWKYVVGILLTAVILFLVWYFSSVVIYILVSAVLAIVGRPLVRRISMLRIRRWSVPRWLARLPDAAGDMGRVPDRMLVIHTVGGQ